MKYFTDEELQYIYDTKINLPDSYFTKYSSPGLCPIKQWNYSWNGHDFPRVWCVLDFMEWTLKYNLHNVDTLGYTCITDPELEFINAQNKICVDYPKYDLHKISEYFCDTFDFFIFNQTIEHLYNPFCAIESVYRTIKPGGYVFTSVPTINIPHSTPFHYNGFNPMGLGILFKSAGFDIVEMGQWGNYEYISKLFNTHYWPAYENLEKNGYISNEKNNVC